MGTWRSSRRARRQVGPETWAHGGPHGERGARWDPGELPSTGSGILAGERQGWDYLATRRHDTHGYVLCRGDERKRTPRREEAANPTKSTKVGGTTPTSHWGHGDTPRRRTGEIARTTPREGSGDVPGSRAPSEDGQEGKGSGLPAHPRHCRRKATRTRRTRPDGD